MKKMTKTDILNIKPGKIEVFVFYTAKAIISARQYVYQIGYVGYSRSIARS